MSTPTTTRQRSYPKDFLSVLDFSHDQLDEVLGLAAAMKHERNLLNHAPTTHALRGRHVALLFEKPSLRTRSTFEVAIHELGGEVLSPTGDAVFGGRETIADVARNLERWVSAVVIRTFAQSRLETFSQAAPRLSVVNALSDQEHPCQAMADVLTLIERWGDVQGRTVAFVGDGNNVANSLAQACLGLGINVHIASPDGYALDAADALRASGHARFGAHLRLFVDPVEAVREANAIYTDVWASMGQESEKAQRDAIFRPYQVNDALMAAAQPGALFMHCLPAHRGDEVTDSVIDSAVSVVFDQAENRLHAQKAILHAIVRA